MARDEILCAETDAIVLPEWKFYPAEIPIAHWQLRHLISSPEPGIIHFASEREIYCLNLEKRTRTRIAELPFAVRCSDSKFGYICAGGGDPGKFAVVSLRGSDAAQVDDPINFGRASSPTVRALNLGSEIVNSVSIHKLEGDRDLGILDDVVAVVTNNDKSVRLFSLIQNVEVAVMDLAFCANHATISPDGQTMVAVGDYQHGYFYERIELTPPDDKLSPRYAGSHCAWELCNVVPLHCPPDTKLSGYFSTAWSPSSALVALASESGYITIYDTDSIRAGIQDEAMVTSFPSSRPQSQPGPGAVRTMLFAPNTLDLLIWAEDQGRVCVADLRSTFRLKQVLSLDPERSRVTKIETERIDDVKAPPIVESENSSTPTPFESDFLRRIRRMRETAMANDGRGPEGYNDSLPTSTRRLDLNLDGLDINERRVLEALRASYQDSRPRSIIYNRESDRSTGRSDPSARSRHLIDSVERSIAEASEDSFRPRHPRNDADTAASLRSFTLGQNLNRTSEILRRQREATYQRLLTSSNAENEGNPGGADTASASTASRHPPLPPHSRLNWSSDLSATAQTISELARHRPSPPPPGSDQHPEILEIRRRRHVMRVRERAHSLREAQRLGRETEDRLFTASTRWMQGEPGAGWKTAGLVVSSNGSRFWAGSENGIWEFDVNMLERRSFPAFQLR